MATGPTTELTLQGGVTLRYGCDLDALGPALAARFAPLHHDAEAAAFVARSLAEPHGAARTMAYRMLRRVLSDYDAYGLLGMYPMHLWSAPQFSQLLSAAGAQRSGRLLDVGAGSGGITAQCAQGFDEVLVTERSPVLRRALQRRGYRVLGLDLGQAALPAALRADVVLCLHVLDRTSHPRTLLAHLRDALTPAGVLVLSLPLPLRPHVQRAGHTVDPEQTLPEAGPDAAGWEAGAATIARALLEPAGLRLRALSRLPYLCHGDRDCALYALDAAVFVCTLGEDPSTTR